MFLKNITHVEDDCDKLNTPRCVNGAKKLCIPERKNRTKNVLNTKTKNKCIPLSEGKQQKQKG